MIAYENVRPPHIGWNSHRDIEGVMLPWWLAVADYSPADRRTLLLPLIINVLWAWIIRSYLLIRRAGGGTRRREMAIRSEGYFEGVADGRKMGIQQGRSEILEALNAPISVKKKWLH